MNKTQREWVVSGAKHWWRLGIFRCAVYASIVMWGMFKSGTQGFDTLSAMTSLQAAYLFGDMIFAGAAGVVLAFIDTALQKYGQPNPPAESEKGDKSNINPT